MGIGIVIAFVLLSLAVAWKSGNHRLGQAMFYVFVGLVLSAAAPGLSQAAHDFITQTANSLMNMNFSK